MRRQRRAPLGARSRIVAPLGAAVAVAVVLLATALVLLRAQSSYPSGSLDQPLAATTSGPSGSASSPSVSSALLTPVPVSVPVAFVGDGLASGTASGTVSGTVSGTDWAARTAATLAAGGNPITVLSATSPGAGFATPSTQELTITQLVDQAVGSGVRVVVIFGGWGDRAASAADVQAGALAAVAEVHRLAPTAAVLLVAPPPAPGLPVPVPVIEGLRRAAVTGTAALLAASGDGWSLGAGTTSGTTAGVPVLTAAGQAAVAARVSPDLASLVRVARAAH